MVNMNSLKIISLVLFIAGFVLIVLGGMYNPYSESITLASGEIKSLSFHMEANESLKLELKSTDFFTMYIMNESAYNHFQNGNFTDSYYTKTTKDIKLIFTAPQTGNYYVVIANINSEGFIDVELIYGYANLIFLTLVGIVVAIISIIILLYDIWKEKKKKIVLDSQCPYCHAMVNSSWNYCPFCRYPLGGEKNER